MSYSWGKGEVTGACSAVTWICVRARNGCFQKWSFFSRDHAMSCPLAAAPSLKETPPHSSNMENSSNAQQHSRGLAVN